MITPDMPPPLPATSTYCQCCGMSAPTMYVSMHRHIGALVLRFHKSLKGLMCKRCVAQKFWEWTPLTLVLGWWGLISMFITPYVLVNNSIMYIKSRSMRKGSKGGYSLTGFGSLGPSLNRRHDGQPRTGLRATSTGRLRREIFPGGSEAELAVLDALGADEPVGQLLDGRRLALEHDDFQTVDGDRDARGAWRRSCPIKSCCSSVSAC